MATKQRVSAREIKAKNFAGSLSSDGGEVYKIPASIWGQLEPLDRKAREKVERWGDTLPTLVAPDLAGRFEAAYEALRKFVDEGNVVKVHEVAAQLIRAWDVLEDAAVRAGHQPLPPHAYAIELEEGQIVCVALEGAPALRVKHPNWTVYSFEDAARVLRHDWTEKFMAEAFNAFPNAKVTKVVRNGEIVDWDLGDEIPW
jgi:hypothetical protein